MLSQAYLSSPNVIWFTSKALLFLPNTWYKLPPIQAYELFLCWLKESTNLVNSMGPKIADHKVVHIDAIAPLFVCIDDLTACAEVETVEYIAEDMFV